MLRVKKGDIDKRDVLVSEILGKDELNRFLFIVNPKRSKRYPKTVFEDEYKKLAEKTLRGFIFYYYSSIQKEKMLSQLFEKLLQILFAALAGFGVWGIFNDVKEISVKLSYSIYTLAAIFCLFLFLWAYLTVIPRHKATTYNYVASVLVENGELEE